MAQKQWSKSDIKTFLESHSYVEHLMDKKTPVAEDDGILLIKGKPCFFAVEKEWIPTLHLLLEQPTLLPKVVVDKGAIKFVVNGADIMRPGIVAADSWNDKGQIVVIVDENVGKPIAVGRSLLSSDDLMAEETGKHIQNLHRIGDDIWNRR